MLTGRALRRRAALAATIPPLLRLHEGTARTRDLAAEIHQPLRLVEDAVRALQREGWVTTVDDRVTLTPMATKTMDAWEIEMAGALQ